MVNADIHDLLRSLGLASAMVAVTVLIHFWGLIAFARVLDRTGRRLRPRESPFAQAALIVLVVFGIFALHTVEIWLYAIVYLAIGEISSLEPALYFATVTFVSLGYGDIVLSAPWRLLSAIEAANGVILIAWSTAFMFAITSRLRMLEHDWLGPRDEDTVVATHLPE